MSSCFCRTSCGHVFFKTATAVLCIQAEQASYACKAYAGLSKDHANQVGCQSHEKVIQQALEGWWKYLEMLAVACVAFDHLVWGSTPWGSTPFADC